MASSDEIMSLQPPFALFVLSDSIDTEYLNYSLRRVWRGNFMASWDFWIATDNYNDIPKASKSNETPQGTIAPIGGSFSSPWIGQTLHNCAQWLSAAPSNITLNKQYFTAMNDHSKKDDTVLVCRVVRSATSGKIDVDYFPQQTDVVGVNMVTNGDAKFDEKAAKYRKSRMAASKLDRTSTGLS